MKTKLTVSVVVLTLIIAPLSLAAQITRGSIGGGLNIDLMEMDKESEAFSEQEWGAGGLGLNIHGFYDAMMGAGFYGSLSISYMPSHVITQPDDPDDIEINWANYNIMPMMYRLSIGGGYVLNTLPLLDIMVSAGPSITIYQFVGEDYDSSDPEQEPYASFVGLGVTANIQAGLRVDDTAFLAGLELGYDIGRSGESGNIKLKADSATTILPYIAVAIYR